MFDRAAKSVPISAEMATALGLPKETTTLTPAELIHAILLAPADLLWNGGIGTYVKASTETNAEIGDRANDAIRVDGNALRVKVIGEGGNLGCSQLGRVEAALHEVRVNTDAIDNSAGVDTSDHEVNIKIPLTALVRDGDMTLKQRNRLLESMTDDVAAEVLRDNYEQNVLLGNARAQQYSMLPGAPAAHPLARGAGRPQPVARVPALGRRDRQAARRTSSASSRRSSRSSSPTPSSRSSRTSCRRPSPTTRGSSRRCREYFPERIREEYATQLAAHPLRREIIINAVVNSMVNRGGITFAFRAGEETGAEPEQIARAFVVCREVFGISSFVAEVEALDNLVSTQTQTVLYLEFRRLLDRASRWFLLARPSNIDVVAEVERFQGPVSEFAPRVHDVLQGSERRRLERRTKELEKLGVPPATAARAASLLDLFSLLDVVDLAEELQLPVEEVAGVYYYASEKFGIDEMLTRVSKLPRDDRWDALARGAMRDDLYAVLESLARSVLVASDGGDAPAKRYEYWADANRDALKRAKTALHGVERLDNAGLAALSVALRTLRSVIRVGQPA